jgi:hypothetical protein
MKLRGAAWVLVLSPVAVLTALGTPSCHSSSAPLQGLASGCSLNSDCDDPLVCIFSLCHQQCTATRDCPNNEACVETPSGNGVCQLASEAPCSPTKQCTGDLVCGLDSQCRAPCQGVGNCLAGQQCTQGACYDPGELDGSTGADGSNEGGSSSGGNEGGGDAPHDGPPVDAGPLGFVPSNFGTLSFADGGVPEAGEGGTPIVGPDGGLDFTDAPDVVISGNANNTSLPAHVVISLGTNPPMFANVYVMKTLTVDSSATLTFDDTNPVIFAVLGAVDIGGEINVGGDQYVGYAGAPTWGGPTSNQGPGGGGNGFTANFPSSGGGGGTFCGVGGKGGAPAGTPAIAGSVYGNATLTPLLAGSGGGYVDGNQWGAGGGAIQISSGSSILIRGVGIVNAGGGSAYGGGGSGGAILLEAPTIDIQGNVTANGGGGGGYSNAYTSTYGNGGQANGQPATGAVVNGQTIGGSGSAGTTITGSDGNSGDASSYFGSGGGGAGWIRLNTSSGSATISGTISPALGTACASQGTLN